MLIGPVNVKEAEAEQKSSTKAELVGADNISSAWTVHNKKISVSDGMVHCY
jgi:hypothetical protein